jgi:hypothetical protein
VIGPIPLIEFADVPTISQGDFSREWHRGMEAFKLDKGYRTNPNPSDSLLFQAWEQGWLTAAKIVARQNYISKHALRLTQPDRLRTSVFLHGMGQPDLVSVLVDCSISMSGMAVSEHLEVLYDSLVMLVPNARLNYIRFAKSALVRSGDCIDGFRGFNARNSPKQGTTEVLPIIDMLNLSGEGKNSAQRKNRTQFDMMGYPRVGADAGSPIILVTDGDFHDISLYALMRSMPEIYVIVLGSY